MGRGLGGSGGLKFLERFGHRFEDGLAAVLPHCVLDVGGNAGLVRVARREHEAFGEGEADCADGEEFGGSGGKLHGSVFLRLGRVIPFGR